MAQFMQKALQLTPNQVLLQQKRFRGKINIRKPKIFFKKAVVNKLVTPFFRDPNEGKTLDQLCKNRKIKKTNIELGPYPKIIAKEVRNWFDQSKMIACLHTNSMPERDKFDLKVLLYRANMYFKVYGSNIVLDAIKNSPYEGITPLLGKYTSFVFSPNINVIDLQKIIRKSKKMYLLGGVLEGQVLTYDEFMKYGQMDIVTAQLGLVQVLQNAGGVNLNRQLTHHQSTLVARLEQIGKNETTSTNESTLNENK